MSKLALLGGEKVRKKPFVGYAIVGDEEKERVRKVLDSGVMSDFIGRAGEKFLGGAQVREFETLVKDYFKVKYAVSVNSATAALHIAVGACGMGPGDEVIVTPYTMSATATSIVMENAVPVFADIEEDTFCLNPSDIEKRITPHTRAVIVVHLFGLSARMDEIMKIAKKHKLLVIEDCAQAPGAIYKGKQVGTWGDIGIFSLNQHKTITCGEGGFAIANNDQLALRMQLIRNHGESVVSDIKEERIDDIVGFNYRMTELEAAVSIGQFKRLNSLNNHRIELADYLRLKLSKLKGLVLPKPDRERKHVYFVFPVKVQESVLGVSRNTLVSALVAEGIPFGGGYVKPIYLEPMYQKKIGYGKQGCPFACPFYTGNVVYNKGICPVTERMHEKELMVTPICRHPHTKDDMDDAVRAFEKIYENINELVELVKKKK